MTLKKSNRKFSFFDTYYFEIKPCYSYFTNTYPNTKLYVDNKCIYTSDKINSFYLCSVPFITGTHEVKAVCESSLGKAETERIMDFVCSLNDNNQVSPVDCSISVDAMFSTVSCNIGDSEVYVNGKLSPEIKSGPADHGSYPFQIGPITDNTNANIYVQKTFPWGTYKSEELNITKGTFMSNDLNIKPIDNDVINNIKSAIAKYNKETLTTALKTQNPSLITDSSYIYELLKKEFDSLSSKNIIFTGNYLCSDITKDNISISSDSESNSYYATVVATDFFDQNYGNDVNCGFIKTSKAGTNNIYTAVYDSKSNTWVVNEIQLIYH